MRNSLDVTVDLILTLNSFFLILFNTVGLNEFGLYIVWDHLNI